MSLVIILILLFSSLLFGKISRDLKPIISTFQVYHSPTPLDSCLLHNLFPHLRSEHSAVSQNIHWRHRLKTPSIAQFPTCGRHLTDLSSNNLSCRSVMLLLNLKWKLHSKKLGFIFLKAQFWLKIIRERIHKKKILKSVPCPL